MCLSPPSSLLLPLSCPPPASILWSPVPGGWGYLEELGVVGAVLAGVGLRVLPAPLQLAEAAGRVKVAGIQLRQINLGEVGVEVLLARHLVLGREEKGGEPTATPEGQAAATTCGDGQSPRAPPLKPITQTLFQISLGKRLQEQLHGSAERREHLFTAHLANRFAQPGTGTAGY